MMFFAKNCLQALRYDRLRVALTGVGVLIGVVSVVLILSLASALLAQLSSTNGTSCTIMLMSSAEAQVDVLAAMQNPDILARVRDVSERSDVTSFTPAEPEQTVDVTLPDGRTVGTLTVQFNDNVGIIVGQSFGEVSGDVVIMFRNPEFPSIAVGGHVLIDGQVFTVVGLTDSLGDNGNTRLYLPARLAGHVHVGEQRATATYILKGQNAKDFGQLRVSVLRELNTGLDPNLKFMDIGADLASTVREALSSVQTFLTAIASISLAVAALNVMNTMYIATLQRTDEIAVMKSMGMTRKQVILLFLFESTIVVAVFAVIGCILGNIGGLLVLSALHVPMVFSWQTVAVLVPITLVVGAGGGFYPAHRAARIDPVRLLR